MSSYRDDNQSAILAHCHEVFGDIAITMKQRLMRFGEEALELLQAGGLTPHQVRQLIDYVYGRAPGEVGQEIGGVMVTLQGLAEAAGLSVEAEEAKEMDRFFAIDPVAFRAKHAMKVAAGV